MVSMHIGRPIMGQRDVDILTLLDFCSEHEFLKGHPSRYLPMVFMVRLQFMLLIWMKESTVWR